MYQIKLNSYAEIITDNIKLETRDYYQFIDEAEDIYYVENKGFIIKYQNDEYFFHFTKNELILYKEQEYHLLPYTHQRLIKNYRMNNGIIESEHEKQDFINKLNEIKPNFSIDINKVLKDSYKKIYGSHEFYAYLLFEYLYALFVLVSIFLKDIDFNEILMSIVKFVPAITIPYGLLYIKNVIKNLMDLKNKYEIKLEKWNEKKLKIEKTEVKELTNSKKVKYGNPIVEKALLLCSKIEMLDINKEEFANELDKIISDYKKYKNTSNKEYLEQEISNRLNELEYRINSLDRVVENNNIINIKTLKKSR